MELGLTGALILGPGGVQTTFPGGETTVALALGQDEYVVSTGVMLAKVASPAAYVPLPGVGTDGPVTKGRLLYLRTNAAVLVRLTTSAGVAVLPIHGLHLLEFPEDQELTLLEAQGASVTVEYLIAGQA